MPGEARLCRPRRALLRVRCAHASLALGALLTLAACAAPAPPGDTACATDASRDPDSAAPTDAPLDAAPRACGSWRPGPSLHDQREYPAVFLVRDGRVAVIGGHYRYSDGQPVNSSEFVDVAAGTSALTGTFNVPRTTSGPGPTLMLANGQEAAMVERRGVAAAVVLRDGRVLVAGGTQRSGGFQPIIASTEIYAPATNSWQRASPMHEARALYTLTLLADGRVLAAGGASESFTRALCSAEIFDPATGTWTLTASMGSARQGTGAVRLPNGEVLIIGGYPGGLRTTEIFTPCE